jgi:LemA protein
MVRYRNKVAESLRLIDIHLKLRFDLIPNLVTTVKAYTKHEKEVFGTGGNLHATADGL